MTIPKSVMSIGNSAFYGCSGLTSITIPNNVTSIKSYAFSGCSSLTSVTIPEDVTSIENSVFSDCSGLTSVTIPNNVTSIGNSAFSDCRNLTSVMIPEGVTSIGDSAFYGCSHLRNVTIPKDVTNIGNSVFFRCSNLRSITIPKGVTSIGEKAFQYCDSLTSMTIPEGVTSIGDSAFYGCSSLTSITLPDSIASIGDNVFFMTALLIDESCWENGVLYLGRHLIKATNTLSDAYEISPETLYIERNAFSGCSGLTSVTIPESVKSIGSSAFSGCRGLTSMTIPKSVMSIGNSAFYGCSGLTSITIPNNVTSIKSYAFSGCSSLTSVTIPEDVTSIENSVFSDCSGLTSVTIPNNVTSIGNSAFSDCSRLTSVKIPNNVTSIGSSAFSGCSSLTSVTIPEDVTSIGDYAFSGCSGLTIVTIPDGVTSIGNHAFSDCSTLTDVKIPDGVTSIGDYAFSGCSSLTDITIPKGVTRIGSNAFRNCPSLADQRGFVIVSKTLYGYYGKSGNVVIPEGVANIDDSAFDGYSGNLTSMTIPKSVNHIGRLAIVGINGLKAVHIHDLAAWCKIRFEYTYSSPSNPLEYAHDLYLNGEKVTELVIPEGVTDIRGSFYGCSLTSLVIPSSVTTIGESAFRHCTQMASITLSEGLTKIGKKAFCNCSGLTSVVIPKSVKDMQRDAFQCCTSLKTVTAMCSSHIFCSEAFEGCPEGLSIVAPFSPLAVLREKGLGMEAARGFIAQSGAYTDPVIVAEYIAYISSQRKKLLPYVFEKDAVEIIRMLAEAKKITKKNLEQDYLLPAMQCRAEMCTAFLESLAESQTGGKRKPLPRSIKGRELWDGKHFSLDGKKLLHYPASPGQTKYEVPEGTVEICASAFNIENGELPEVIILPKSIKWVRNGAFSLNNKASLIVQMSSGETAITPGAFSVWGDARVYIVTSDQKLANELWNYGFVYAIYVGELDDLAPKAKNHAVKGFLYASEHNAVEMSPWRPGYLAHIKRSQKTYVKEAPENPYLFHLMLEEKLLSEKSVKELLDALGDKTPEQTTELLDYQQNQFGGNKKKDAFSLSEDDPELKRMLKMQERQEQIKGQKGIKGLVFVSTGYFEHFGEILGSEYSFEGKDMSDLKAYIEARGGVYRSSVSSKTDYLICNDPNSNSAKSRKAAELGIPVITEEEFLKMANEKIEGDGD